MLSHYLLSSVVCIINNEIKWTEELSTEAKRDRSSIYKTYILVSMKSSKFCFKISSIVIKAK